MPSPVFVGVQESPSHIHIFSREKSKFISKLLCCIWMMRQDREHHGSLIPCLLQEALPWAWLWSQVYGEIALSQVTSFSMRASRHMEQTAPEKVQITSQGSTGVCKGRVPAGSFWPYSLCFWSMRLPAQWRLCDFRGFREQLEVLRVVYTRHSTNGCCQQSKECLISSEFS